MLERHHLPDELPGILELRLDRAVAAPLVLDSPHSGRAPPPDFAPAVGPERWLRAADLDVDELVGAARELGLPLLAACFPRIYLDVNRAADDIDPATLAGVLPFEARPSPKAALGKGLVWLAVPPGGEPLYALPLPADVVQLRIAGYWEPYHAALAATLAAVRQRFGRVYHLDCHSMQAVSNAMHEEGPGRARPDIVLSDRDGASCDPAFTTAAKAILDELGFSVQVNDPYKGAEIVRRHGDPANARHSLQIEINRKLYMDERRLERSADFARTRERLGLFLERLAAWTLAT